MKFAIINGNKVEAYRGAKGICPSCGSELIAKCGEVKINHWAHKGNRNCDLWWENETEWHRQWKNQFPKEWQEIVHFDEKGEKHIADVKTKNGWVLEFQHSYIKPEERNYRNAFYSKLVWIIDGLRRKTDRIQF
jgi:competence CoiA-like predicted nuclease